jgi:hypothetical protein
MSIDVQSTATRADDGFERHYAEKLWSLMPEIYRHEDGLAANPGQLRALVEIIAVEAATARRSVDRLWADTRIDEADDWAVPYIGSLVGARLVNILNRPGRRASVKRAIYYRLRNGTRALLETLADDIADWDAVASEAFKRLYRTMHLLDGLAPAGPITGSPQWGFPDIRSARIGDTIDGPFDDVSHRPDFRRIRGFKGRYNIPKVNLHLFRHYAFALRGVTPVQLDDQHWMLDPSGRDVALYQRGGTPGEECRTRREWEIRGPLDCRRLNAATFEPDIEDAPPGMEVDLALLYGRLFRSQAELLHLATALRPDITLPQNVRQLLSASITENCAKRNLLPGGDPATLSLALAVDSDPDATPAGPEILYGADLSNWADGLVLPAWAEIFADLDNGRVLLNEAPVGDDRLIAQLHYYGAFWPVGAGTHDRALYLEPSGFSAINNLAPDFSSNRNGTERFVDSATYRPVLAAGDTITVDSTWRLEAANGERPYVAVSVGAGGTVTLSPLSDGGILEIDGLWLAILTGIAGTVTTRLVLDGAWSLVRFSNTTLDPGGELAALPGDLPGLQPAIVLEAAGEVDTLVIDRCITGPISESISAIDPCSANEIIICDSIVIGQPAAPAIRARNASIRLERSTVFGDVVAGRLHADHLLADGRLIIEDAQSSCVRFSAAIAHDNANAIDGYESTFYDNQLPASLFMSRRFGDASLAQLRRTAPPEISRGGEDGTEIGAYNRALAPIKHDDLRAKTAEHMPINAIAQFIFET